MTPSTPKPFNRSKLNVLAVSPRPEPLSSEAAALHSRELLHVQIASEVPLTCFHISDAVRTQFGHIW